MATKRPTPATPQHLAASLRVLQKHRARPALTIGDAQEAVKELALVLGTGEPTKDDLVLEMKLLKATGVSVAELAHFAEDWPV